ncbi:MAG: S41 family peptidase [Bacteroidales bacterium]|nr:S41 family peptidase [Bacteroidales bacterium]
MKQNTFKKNLINIGFILIIVIFILGKGFAQHYDPKTTIQKYASAIQIISFAYVDTVNEPALVEKAIISTLNELDPHSQYISKKDLKKANEPLEGNFEGIGITYQIFRDTILVIAPIPGGPSEKLGIMAGDKIVKIEGEDATGDILDKNFVFKRLRGKKGTKVDVSIFRKGKKDLIDYTIVRDKIPINSIDASFMAAPEIGYIKINKFSRTTMDGFHKSLNKLQKEGMTMLILDLRGNSGGFMDVAIDLADEFLENGKLVVYTEGISSPTRKYKATQKGSYEKGKLVVLIDEGSASASEIVSGAIQDWDRGIVIGRRSFGKGLVQRPFFLPDSSVIRLTIARYHTPTGRCIQKPYDEGYKKYRNDFYNRLEHGELINPDSINFPDSLKYFTPHNRIVYGGGGIMPDVFVPLDSTWISDYYINLQRKGIINDFILEYIENERENLNKKYSLFNKFSEKFVIDDAFMNNFIEVAENKDVEMDEEQFKASEEILKYRLKALIARNLWDNNSYFEIMLQIDDGFMKAIEILQDGSLFAELKIY